MTISLLGSLTHNAQDAGITNTVSHTLNAGSGRISYALVHHYSSTYDISGVTYGGVSMTNLSTANALGIYRKLSVWRLFESSLPSDGSKSVIATFAGSVAQSSIIVFTIQGATQAEDAIGTPYVNNSSSATASMNITTIGANAWAFSAGASEAFSTFTHGTGQTELDDYGWNGSVKSGLSISYEEIVSPGANTQTDISSASDRLLGVAWSVAPASAVSSRKNRLALLGVG